MIDLRPSRTRSGAWAGMAWNVERWRALRQVERFAHRRLAPVEVVILARYREALSGRVLELGCGAGRIIGYLLALGGEVHGIDISPRMVERCRRAYPGANVREGDLRALERAGGPFDAILALDNVLDVLDHEERERTLAAIRGLLAPSGLFAFSSHNLGHLDELRPPLQARAGAARTLRRAATRAGSLLGRTARVNALEAASLLRRAPVRWRNRRRMRPLERRGEGYALVNDEGLDYALLHYYIDRDGQAAQLERLGFELLECLDVEGAPVGRGERAPGAPWLHYIALARSGSNAVN